MLCCLLRCIWCLCKMHLLHTVTVFWPQKHYWQMLRYRIQGRQMSRQLEHCDWVQIRAYTFVESLYFFVRSMVCTSVARVCSEMCLCVSSASSPSLSAAAAASRWLFYCAVIVTGTDGKTKQQVEARAAGGPPSQHAVQRRWNSRVVQRFPQGTASCVRFFPLLTDGCVVCRFTSWRLLVSFWFLISVIPVKVLHEWNETALILSVLKNWNTVQTNPSVEQNKSIKWSESPWNQSGRKGKGFTKEPSL